MTKTVIGAAAIAMLALTGAGNAIAEDASTEITAPRTVVESATSTSMTRTSIMAVGTRSSSTQ